jgi:hypothetical protein
MINPNPNQDQNDLSVIERALERTIENEVVVIRIAHMFQGHPLDNPKVSVTIDVDGHYIVTSFKLADVITIARNPFPFLGGKYFVGAVTGPSSGVMKIIAAYEDQGYSEDAMSALMTMFDAAFKELMAKIVYILDN